MEDTAKKIHPDVEQKVPLNSEKDEELEKLTTLQKLKFFKNNITIEPSIGIFIMLSVSTMLTVQNLNLEKACRVNLKFNDSVCTSLNLRKRDNLSYEEDEVQKLVASVEGWKTVIYSVFPVILMLFTGAWSDKTGRRKICLLLPLLGEFISSVLNIINTYFFYEVFVEWTAFMAIIFPALTGAWSMLFLGAYSYIVDITSKQTRTFRLGVLTLGYTIGIPMGTGFCGIILRYAGYYGAFGISALVQLLNFLYVLFYIEDHRWLENKNKGKGGGCVGFLGEFFNFKSLKDTIFIAFKKGPNNRRLRICLLLTVILLTFGPAFGEITLLYIFTRYKFNWDEVKYSIFSTYNFTLHASGTFFIICVFSKKLKYDDSVLGIISTSSRLCGALVYAFARTTKEIYLGEFMTWNYLNALFANEPIAELFSSTTLIALRSIASKLVPPHELGKVYSMFGVVEAMMPVVFAPVYAKVYILTLQIMPGAIFLITVFCTIPTIGIFILFYCWHRKDTNAARKAALDINFVSKDAEK